ncbi:MAG TPA: TonB-dependent receptor [Bryobacteraceae bacterium]|nr:TonB-dependent receptor [Bryobacteraceae bacterium]
MIWRSLAALLFAAAAAFGHSDVSGVVLDPRGDAVPGAVVELRGESGPLARAIADGEGRYRLAAIPDGSYRLTADAPGLTGVSEPITLSGQLALRNLRFSTAAEQKQTVVVTSGTLEPGTGSLGVSDFAGGLRNRDDQLLQGLRAGIDAGQHEGGGKSVEIRRFGFNLDHGGVNGGLAVLVDGVQQNQATQGHGQGYLGSLKSLSPELISEVTVTDGPFRAEYGDFSGLGVVHIHQRENLPDHFTARLEGGNIDTGRGFFAYSPELDRADAYVAYDGSYTDGPFQNPGRYRRDNLNGNYARTLRGGGKLGFRLLLGRNDFYSSGQLPLDLVNSGRLDRFAYLDPSDGGRVRLGTASAIFSKTLASGDLFQVDGFVARSLFDLYSDFTFYLRDPVHGDAIQQHDSRLQQGMNAKFTRARQTGPVSGILVAGTNFHDNEINVGLYPREGRDPTGVLTHADAHVTNGAAYAQQNGSFWRGRLLLGGGLRYDEFRFAVSDRIAPQNSGIQNAGRWQGKGSASFTPIDRLPLTLYANYGRGINSSDARAVVERPEQPRVATTDFYQWGAASHFASVSLSADTFLIDHSNEQVYIPDDGSFEFHGPSRTYGWEVKLATKITLRFALSGNVTKVLNAFYRGPQRVYVDSAPHLVAGAELSVAAWRGWRASLVLRAINHYRLDGKDPAIVASGHTVIDAGLSRPIRRGIEWSLNLGNVTNRAFYETQNYFVSRTSPDAPAIARIHGTPGYPLTAVMGLTFRLRGK